MGQELRNSVRFVARKATTVWNMVSPSLFPKKKKDSTTWLSMLVFYRCGHNRCLACEVTAVSKTFSSTSLPELPPFRNDSAKWVIYLITCQICSVQYVGCTSNPLKVRIRRHLSDATNLDALGVSAASRHFIDVHQIDLCGFSFIRIERVFRDPRGGDMKRAPLMRETRWTFDLGTSSPAGLNIR